MNTAPNPNPGLASDTAKSTKNLAAQIAKQMVREPWEIFKDAGEQITGKEEAQNQNVYQAGNSAQSETNSIENEAVLEQRDKVRSQRLIQALEAEIKQISDIKKQNKIAEEKEEQLAKEEQVKSVPLVEPAARKSRRLFNFGANLRPKNSKPKRKDHCHLPVDLQFLFNNLQLKLHAGHLFN
jgi:vacuolar-type H+-ATPase catalytic subunit A/Vma1